MAQFQVKTGSLWTDIELDCDLARIERELACFSEPLEGDIVACPDITDLVLVHCGGKHYAERFLDWELDWELTSASDHMLKASYCGHFRQREGWTPHVRFSGEVTILPR